MLSGQIHLKIKPDEKSMRRTKAISIFQGTSICERWIGVVLTLDCILQNKYAHSNAATIIYLLVFCY